MFLNTEKILKFWVKDPKPTQSNETLLAFKSLAEAKLLRIFPNIEERLQSESGLEDSVNYAASVAIQRAMDPLAGLSSTSEGAGPFSKSYSFEKSKDGFFFTEEELEDLQEPGSGVYNFFGIIANGPATPNFNTASSRAVGEGFSRWF